MDCWSDARLNCRAFTSELVIQRAASGDTAPAAVRRTAAKDLALRRLTDNARLPIGRALRSRGVAPVRLPPAGSRVPVTEAKGNVVRALVA